MESISKIDMSLGFYYATNNQYESSYVIEIKLIHWTQIYLEWNFSFVAA